MCQRDHKWISWILPVVLMGIVPGDAWGGQVRADVDGSACAKGVVVLRLTFPSRGEVWRVALSNSRDGETFHEAGFGLLGVRDLFRSVVYEGGNTVILVPAVGWFGTEISFFGEPDTYWFDWVVTFRDQNKPRTVPEQLDKDIEAVRLEQLVRVKRAQPADLAFIAALGEPELAQIMFGEDSFEGRTDAETRRMLGCSRAELRALALISVMLEATRANEPGDVVGPRGGLENALKWGDALFGLAKEFPDSSYAPYAAYYAGCCYVTALGQENKEKHKEIVSPAGKESAYYGKAKEALSFAVERADAYLKPRALYHQAFLHGCAAEFDRVDESLDEALEVGGREGTIQKIVDKLRSDMRTTREKQAAKEQP